MKLAKNIILLASVLIIYIIFVLTNKNKTLLTVHEIHRNAQIVYQYRPGKLTVDKFLKFRMSQMRKKFLGQKNLADMKFILPQNSEVIPTKSSFGTTSSQSICTGEDELNCVSKLKEDNTRYSFVPAQKLLACLIPKNASSILQAVLCYLYKSFEFVKAQRKIYSEHYLIRFCGEENAFGTDDIEIVAYQKMNMSANKLMATWKPFTTIRDPIDRFLSGFLDICVRKRNFFPEEHCNGCGQNLTCFITSEYKRMIAKNYTKPTMFDDIHFFPQSWRCNFKSYLNNFQFMRYNNSSGFLDELESILREKGVEEEKLLYIRKNFQNHYTAHTTVKSKARLFFENRLKSSPFLLEYLVRMFYWDYQIFNYPIPEFNFM